MTSKYKIFTGSGVFHYQKLIDNESLNCKAFYVVSDVPYRFSFNNSNIIPIYSFKLLAIYIITTIIRRKIRNDSLKLRIKNWYQAYFSKVSGKIILNLKFQHESHVDVIMASMMSLEALKLFKNKGKKYKTIINTGSNDFKFERDQIKKYFKKIKIEKDDQDNMNLVDYERYRNEIILADEVIYMSHLAERTSSVKKKSTVKTYHDFKFSRSLREQHQKKNSITNIQVY